MIREGVWIVVKNSFGQMEQIVMRGGMMQETKKLILEVRTCLECGRAGLMPDTTSCAPRCKDHDLWKVRSSFCTCAVLGAIIIGAWALYTVLGWLIGSEGSSLLEVLKNQWVWATSLRVW